MPYLSEDELKGLRLKHLGSNVKISTKASIYDAEKIHIGDNCRIDDFCVISGSVKMGRNVFIAPHCLVAGGELGVEFGDFSTLAYYVQVFSQSDDYLGETLTNSTVPAKFKSEKKAAVFLGRHVIIGAGSIVMPGVEVADGCSVGAHSLVNRSTAPWGVYFGSPARRIRERSKGLLELEKAYLSEQQNDSV